MPVSDLATLIRTMEPALHPGRYVFATLPAGRWIDPTQVVASIREAEGDSVIVPEEVARAEGLASELLVSWITLTVHSDLATTGLTAAFTTALARAGVPCNVVAGTRHDHVFVPAPQAQAALAALRTLQRNGCDDDRA
jgi:hypothetical protein